MNRIDSIADAKLQNSPVISSITVKFNELFDSFKAVGTYPQYNLAMQVK